jgi:hypothetical protein
MEDVSISQFFSNEMRKWKRRISADIVIDIELNFLVCNNAASGYYDLYLQTGSDTPSGKTCSNYQTIHLPCLC